MVVQFAWKEKPEIQVYIDLWVVVNIVWLDGLGLRRKMIRKGVIGKYEE